MVETHPKLLLFFHLLLNPTTDFCKEIHYTVSLTIHPTNVASIVVRWMWYTVLQPDIC